MTSRGPSFRASRHARSLRRSRALRRAAGFVVLASMALGPIAGAPAASPAGASGAGSSRALLPNVAADVRAGLRPPTRGPSATPNVEGGVTLSVLRSLSNGTPLYNGDFADPYALVADGALYVYATNTEAGTAKKPVITHVPVLEVPFDKLFQGKYLGDALPKLPPWTSPGLTWAPSVWSPSMGHYVMYYATPDISETKRCGPRPSNGCAATFANAERQCISRATASSPAGPFVDDSKGPLICPLSQGGAIDPSIFVTNSGVPYLLWKSDGERFGLPTVLYSQRLSADGLAMAGPPTALLSSEPAGSGPETNMAQKSDGNIEAPSMIQEGTTYWLFYSENLWASASYNIGIARCASVRGPCQSALPFGTWMSTDDPVPHEVGPGGQEFFSVGNTGLVWMVHHAYLPGQAGLYGVRRLYVDLLVFPRHGLPELAPRYLAGALAEIGLNLANADLPANPTRAYLELAARSQSPLAKLAPSTLLADGRAACAALADKQTAVQIGQLEANRGLDPFEQYTVTGFAALELCRSHLATALADLRSLVVQT